MLSRDELYAMIWSQPMTEIAKRFEVSSSYLARVCTLLNVPRPQRGYWAKLAVGKAPPRTTLPPPQAGDPLHWTREGERRVTQRPTAPTRRTTGKKVSIARNRAHRLISGTRMHFEKGRPVDDGAYLRPYKKLLVDVTASADGLEKALSLANDLFNALESVGYRVVIAASDSKLGRIGIEEREGSPAPRDHWQSNRLWTPFRPTVVYVGTVAVGLAVIEMSEQVLLRYIGGGKYVRERDHSPPRGRLPNQSWTTTRDFPSGRLRIVAYAPYGRINWSSEWQEDKSRSLRSQIGQIIEAIEAQAPELVLMLEKADRQAEIREQEWRAQQEERRREEDSQRVEKAIADSKAELGTVIEKWARVRAIEQFLAGVERSAATLPEHDKREILDRLERARAFVGSQDPLEFFRNWRTPDERYMSPY